MQVTYRFCPERRLILAKYSGEVGTEHFINSYSEGRRVSAATGATHAIFDFSAADLSTIQTHAILSLGSSPPVIPDGGTQCIVAPPDYMFGIARMFQAVTGRDMHICRSLEKAYAVLGISTAPSFQDVTPGPNGTLSES